MNEKGYENKLKEEFGVDLEHCRQAIGHPGGVHGDNMYLIAKLMESSPVRGAVEFGSGLSSLALGLISDRLGVRFTSFEDWPHWATVANTALENLGSSHRVISTYCLEENCPPLEEVQVVFVDGNIVHPVGVGNEPGEHPQGISPEFAQYSGRHGACAYYTNSIQNAVVILDDSEFLADCWEHIVSTTLGRRVEDTIFFNPTQRTNRIQAISLPEMYKEIFRSIIEEVNALGRKL